MIAALFLVACSTTRTLPADQIPTESGRAVKIETDAYTGYAVTIAIDAPPARVWELLIAVDDWSGWTSSIVRASGSVEVGQTVTLVSSLDPEREFALTVAEVDPEHRLAWEDGMPMGLFSGVRTYTLEPVGPGTRFTMSEVFSGGMASMIVGSIPDMRASFETFAADLKAAAETP